MSEVATILCMSRLVTFLSAGTITKPPPTPNIPVKSPAIIPMLARTLPVLKFQMKRPVLGLT
ncbi:hypothetical protein D3C80_1734520 [compost metagenome]